MPNRSTSSASYARSDTMSSGTTTVSGPWWQSPVPWQPHAGQKKIMKFLVEHAAAGVIAEPGVGKTSATYGAFKVLRRKGLARKMLVIAPLKPCHLVWGPEQRKWCDFADLRVEILHGPKKAEALAREADVYVINYDGLDWLLDVTWTVDRRGHKHAKVDVARFRKFGFDTLVCDELTRMKHRTSGRHKALKTVLDTFARRWGLTGTPNPNGLMDLFGQCYILDMGRTFGPYITHFRQTYFVPGYDGYTWALKDGAKEKIYERVAPLFIQLAAADYVDMPDVVPVVTRFDLPPSAREVYDQLEDELFVKIDEHDVVAANSAVASMKCRQVACGGLYYTPEDAALFRRRKQREWVDLHTEKIELVADLVEELNGAPLLVGYEFQHDLARLRARFGDDVPTIAGGVGTRQAKEIEAAWNARKLPILLAQPQSAALGLNLQGGQCQHVCWHSMPWDWELYDQLVRRVRRQGSGVDRVFVHHLIARDTVEEAQFWAVQAKGKGQEAFFEGLKKLRALRK